MADKCDYCDRNAWDACASCGTPVCEMHGVLIRDESDIICMPCKRRLLEQEEDGSRVEW